MRSLRFQIVFFTFARTVFNTLQRMVYPFLSVFARGLGVDITLLSYALTARFITGFLGTLLSAAADARGRRFGMLAGLGLFSLSAGLVVFFPVFPVLAVALCLATLGRNIFEPSMQAYLGDRIPYQQRGRAIAITEAGWSMAFILGIPLMGFLIARKGWMAPFPLLALLGVLLFLGLAWMMPREAKPTGGTPTVWANFRTVLGYTPALAGFAIGILATSANEMVNLIFGVWLEDSFGLQIAALGAASAVIGISELSAEGMVAAFVDRLGKPRAIGLGLAANSLAALALYFLGGTEAGALAGLFLFYLTFEFTVVSLIPMMTEVVPGARATVMAFNVAFMSLGRAVGAFIAPRLYGLGFPFVVAGAILFNILAVLALVWQQRHAHAASPKVDKNEPGPA